MLSSRSRWVLVIGSASASLGFTAPAFADSFPSGWTADDAPEDAQQQTPPAPAPRAVTTPRPAQVAPTPQNDSSSSEPDDSAAPSNDAAPPNNAESDTDPSALNAFNQTLAGHGAWVDDPNYGRIWVPNSEEVGESFAPYQSAGHWALDDNSEWLWMSDYSWGHVPFHYGRWLWVPARGWGWIPGRVYSPAWVSWRTGAGGYIGWAPTAPGYYWSHGRAVGFANRPTSAYCFAPTSHVFAHNVGAYVARTPASVRAAAASTRAYHGANPTRSGGRSSPTAADAHVSASAAAHAQLEGRVAATPHASSHGWARGGSTSGYHGAFGHGSAGRGGNAYGHADNRGRASEYSHASPTFHTPSQHASSSQTHSHSGGAKSSGHSGGHHR